MPTTYNDQFWVIDAFSPPPVGTTLVHQRFDLRDNNDDGDFDRFNTDRIDGSDITSSYPGDTITVTLKSGTVTYTGITFYLADGRSVFTPTDGQVLQTGTFVSSTFVSTQGPLLVGNLGPPCLTPGVLVDAARGRLPVECLQPGDRLETLDRGPQPVLWVGRTELRADACHAPVRFEVGALGNSEAFCVSPQHRMFVDGWQAELHFGQTEVLVSAVHLVGLPGVTRMMAGRVTYLHVLLETHELIRTAGLWSESYHPAASIERHEEEIRKALPRRFARLAEGMRSAPLARPQVTGREARVLAA
ncbi:Hint domain-containing protein [Roseibacterium sp. SDUM158016]|uniref:Hint domain-containing protein n=1 Tax=Roseicyclus sediminis TaxID=2980997 RepID=UPI0021CE82D6|nr:Hint domain-containing protein [Roseibacterium sp. SDUM158016]MCU4652236.1 Hint domain-containing protein [Roseibacterium sp. SDUM158016]